MLTNEQIEHWRRLLNGDYLTSGDLCAQAREANELRERLDVIHKLAPGAQKELNELREKLAAAKAALRTYGSHLQNCAILTLYLSDPPKRRPCDCGLQSAIGIDVKE